MHRTFCLLVPGTCWCQLRLWKKPSRSWKTPRGLGRTRRSATAVGRTSPRRNAANPRTRGARRYRSSLPVNVVGPAVQKDERRTIRGAGFGVSDVQDAGLDLFHSCYLFSLPAHMTRKAARPQDTTSCIPLQLPARGFLAGRSVTYLAPLPRERPEKAGLADILDGKHANKLSVIRDRQRPEATLLQDGKSVLE